ncbi:MAG TPA: TolC family protein [Terriglobales bacterium]|nr:TolC family protein [Terriglobales bacterium]
MAGTKGQFLRHQILDHALSSLLLALVILASGQVQAQQQAFTWEQIRDKFLATNATLRAQAQSIESNRANEITAALHPNPQFQNDTTSATLGIYQELEMPGKRPSRMQSARLATSISQTDFLDSRRTLLFNLRQAFFQALLAKSNLDFARDNLANYQKVVDLNRTMFEAGQISRADFLKIELQMLQFQTDLDDAALALRTAKATLRALVGPNNFPQDFDVQGDLRVVPLEKSLSELQQLALANRPDLKSAETGRQKAFADLRLAKANRWPDPTIGTSFLHTGNEIGGPSWFEPFYPKGQTSNAMGLALASISIPIFNRNQGEVARTRSEQLRANFLAQAVHNQVLQDVEIAYASFESSRERVRLYDQTYLSRAKESLDIEEFSFRQGAASILDFLDATRTYRAAQLAYRQQLAAYLTNLAQLEAAVGAPVTP